MKTFLETLAMLQDELERIQVSETVGIIYVSDRHKREVYEPDPALKEAIVEYYENRIRQMIHWQNSPGLNEMAQPNAYPIQAD